MIAWALFIVGASWNANVVRADAPFCPYLKDGIFAGGGVLTLAATALGITSFIMLRRQPVEAVAAATPAASVGGTTPNRPGGQSPSSEVVMGHPLLPPPSKAQHFSKPQAYVQQVAPASHPQPQGNGQVPHHLQAPPPPAAGGQDHGSQAANHQFLPQGLPAGAALAAAACAPQEPGEQPPPPPLGVAMGQPQVQLPPQVSVPNDTLQYPIPAPQVCAEAPVTVTPPAPGASQGTGLSTVIRGELARATIRFAGKAMEHAVFSNSNNTATSTTTAGDILSMVTDPTGGDAGATDNGVAVVV